MDNIKKELLRVSALLSRHLQRADTKISFKHTAIWIREGQKFVHRQLITTKTCIIFDHLNQQTTLFVQFTHQQIVRLCSSMLPHNRTINNDVISPNVLT